MDHNLVIYMLGHSRIPTARPRKHTRGHCSLEIWANCCSVCRKLVIIGDGACGKTSLLSVFTLGYFPTVSGIEFPIESKA